MTQARASRWGGLAHPIRSETPELELPWRDNAFFTFWDLKHDVHGFVHVMTSPNSEGRRAKCGLRVGDAFAEVVEPLEPGSFESDSIAYALEGRITVDAPGLKAELDLAPKFAGIDYTASQVFPGITDEQPLNHWQGYAQMTGTATVREHTTDVDGTGVRDRTWGYRDESAAIQEYFAVVVGFEDRGMTLMKFRDAKGSDRVYGFLAGETELQALTGASLTRDSAGLFKGAEIEVEDGPGFELELIKRHNPGIWLHMSRDGKGPTMSAYEDYISVRTTDGREAHGVCEQGIVRSLS